MQLRRFILLSAGLVAIDAGSVRACTDPAVTSAAANKNQTPSAIALVAWKPRPWAPATANGLRVSIDPVDGAYGMTNADETAQSIVSREDSPVAVTRRANGWVRAQLDERWADFAVVVVDADGVPHWSCVHGSRQADQFMRTPSPVLPPAPGTVWVEK